MQVGNGFEDSMAPHDRTPQGVTAYLRQQSLQIFQIQAHATTHTWMDDGIFPEAAIAFRLTHSPPLRGLILHEEFDNWLIDAIVAISSWATHSILRDTYSDYLIEAQQWSRNISTNSEPIIVHPTFLSAQPLIGWIFINIFGYGMTATMDGAQLTYAGTARQWPAHLFADVVSNTPTLLSLQQVHTWHDVGEGVLTWIHPRPDQHHWRLGFPSGHCLRLLRDQLSTLVTMLSSHLTQIAPAQKKKSAFTREIPEIQARHTLRDRLNSLHTTVDSGHDTIHIRIHVEMDSLDAVQHHLTHRQRSDNLSQTLFFLRITLSPTNTWTAIPSDWTAFRLVHLLMLHHRVHRPLGQLNYYSLPKDRLGLANYLDHIIRAYSEMSVSLDQAELAATAMDLIPILRSPRSDRINSQGRFLNAEGDIPPRPPHLDLLTQLLDSLDVFPPRLRQPGTGIWWTTATETLLTWFQIPNSASSHVVN